MLKNFGCALHIRVTASLETRIRNLVERGYEKKSIEHAIEMSDRDRSGFMRFAFGVDWSDSQGYDLVLNTDKLDLHTAAETVVSMAQSGSIKDCSRESLETLGNNALVSRAEAAIAEARVSFGFNTTVHVSVEEHGKVQLSGYVYDEGSKVQAEEVIKALNGIEGIVNQIRVMPMEIVS